MAVSPNELDLWAELRRALDELEQPHDCFLDRQCKGADWAAVCDGGDWSHCTVRDLWGPATFAYSGAVHRAHMRDAHEAIEKGIKALLKRNGLELHQLRMLRHDLGGLLECLKKHDRPAFDELERCFDATTAFLNSLRPAEYQLSHSMLDYLSEHGEHKKHIELRYASVEGNGEKYLNIIVIFYAEVIRALIALMLGLRPETAADRIENELRYVIQPECHRLLPHEQQWVTHGMLRQNLEGPNGLSSYRVSQRAIRHCRKSRTDRAVRHWGTRVRDRSIARWRNSKKPACHDLGDQRL